MKWRQAPTQKIIQNSDSEYDPIYQKRMEKMQVMFTKSLKIKEDEPRENNRYLPWKTEWWKSLPQNRMQGEK